MESIRPDTLWMCVAALASLVALGLAGWMVGTRWARGWAIQARARHAVEGEAAAAPLLRRAGYDVVASQVPGGWTLLADGERHDVALRADLLVARGGRRYVAEVKTGKVAPRLDFAATRRQLLEYRMAFGVDGVLLVDADARRVRVIEFPLADERTSDPSAMRFAWVPGFAFGAALGAVVVWLLRT